MKSTLFPVILTLVRLSSWTSQAFFVSSQRRQIFKSSHQVFARVDSSRAIEEAFQAAENFGVNSKEARLAWEKVEEMDSSDSSSVFEQSDSALMSKSTEDLHAEEYSTHIRNLSILLEDTSNVIQQMKTLCNILQNIELDDPRVTKLGLMSSMMARALSEAKAADDVFGPNSPEASNAWNVAENVFRGKRSEPVIPTDNRYKETAVSSHHNYMTVVDLRTLMNAMDAFGKIEHLQRLVRMESHRISTKPTEIRP